MPEFASLFNVVPEPVHDPMDLSRFNESVGSPKTLVRSYVEVPDGRYRAQITDLELGLASTGNPILKYGLRVSMGEFAGRMIWKRRVITVNTLRFMKKDLLTCGLLLDRFSHLGRRLGELQGVGLEVSKVTKGDSSDVYFHRRVVD